HCDDVGRDYDDVIKTVMGPLDPGADGEKVDRLVSEMQRLAGLGISHYHGSVPGACCHRCRQAGRHDRRGSTDAAWVSSPAHSWPAPDGAPFPWPSLVAAERSSAESAGL